MITEATIKQEKYWDENRIYTIDEYFELEEKAPFKSEFHNGKVIPLHSRKVSTDNPIRHAIITGNIHFQLRISKKSFASKIQVYNHQIPIHIPNLNLEIHADGSVVIGESQTSEKDKAITNPAIIFEVLSDSTGSYDRGEKFRKYKQLSSFREYVLIEQDQPAIDVLYKNENDIWEMYSYIGLEDEMELWSINVKIPLSDIYEDVKDLVLPQRKIDLE